MGNQRQGAGPFAAGSPTMNEWAGCRRPPGAVTHGDRREEHRPGSLVPRPEDTGVPFPPWQLRTLSPDAQLLVPLTPDPDRGDPGLHVAQSGPPSRPGVSGPHVGPCGSLGMHLRPTVTQPLPLDS